MVKTKPPSNPLTSLALSSDLCNSSCAAASASALALASSSLSACADGTTGGAGARLQPRLSNQAFFRPTRPQGTNSKGALQPTT